MFNVLKFFKYQKNLVKILFIVLNLILVFLPITFGNTLTLNDRPLPNYNLIFFSEKTKVYKTSTDNNGNFYLSDKDLTDNTSRNDIIRIIIGRNLTIAQNNRIVIGNIISIGHFVAIKDGMGLNIFINKNDSGSFTTITQTCKDENLYFCSVTLFSYNEGILSHETFFPKHNGTQEYTFKPLFNNSLPEGLYSVSRFASDGPNVILEILNYKTVKINLTNPYAEKTQAIIKTKDTYCLFENGKNESTEIFEPKETKEIRTLSKENVPCNIEYVFIKIDKFNISFELFTIFSFYLIPISILIYLIYKKKILKNK